VRPRCARVDYDDYDYDDDYDDGFMCVAIAAAVGLAGRRDPVKIFFIIFSNATATGHAEDVPV